MNICKYCEYWKNKNEDVTTGDCRRFPPTVISVNKSTNPYSRYETLPEESEPEYKTVYPRTDWDNSCGEFRDAEHMEQEDGFFDESPEPDKKIEEVLP